MTTKVHPNAVLAKAFIERSQHLGLKGKKRDDALLDFWAGAYSALQMVGADRTAHNVGMMGALVLSVRGYSELTNIITSAEQDKSFKEDPTK